jgi:hypothetical protein
MELMHPALLKSSGWRYSGRARDLTAARWWGCPSPGAFDVLPKHERTDIVAMYEVSWRIEAVNAYEASKPKKRRRR